MLFHQVFRKGKLEADSKPNCICKTELTCPHRSKRGISSERMIFAACRLFAFLYIFAAIRAAKKTEPPFLGKLRCVLVRIHLVLQVY